MLIKIEICIFFILGERYVMTVFAVIKLSEQGVILGFYVQLKCEILQSI